MTHLVDGNQFSFVDRKEVHEKVHRIYCQVGELRSLLLINPESCRYAQPLLSLNSCSDFNEVGHFLNRLQWCGTGVGAVTLEDKIDGVSIAVTYLNGRLLSATTRNRNITDIVKAIPSIPYSLSGAYPELVEVHGEVYVSKEIFKKFNELLGDQGTEAYATTRNYAAASLMLTDALDVYNRRLDTRFYGLGLWAGKGPQFPESQPGLLHKFNEWGLRAIGCSGPFYQDENLKTFLKALQSSSHSLPYDVDGIVIKALCTSIHQKMGCTARAPRWALAYKF